MKTNRKSNTVELMQTIERNVHNDVHEMVRLKMEIEDLLYEVNRWRNRRAIKCIESEADWMNKIDWKAKLSSRKFWALLAALVVAVLAMFAVPENTVAQISGIITALGAVAVYILAEAKTDAASLNAEGQKAAAQIVASQQQEFKVPEGYVMFPKDTFNEDGVTVVEEGTIEASEVPTGIPVEQVIGETK